MSAPDASANACRATSFDTVPSAPTWSSTAVQAGPAAIGGALGICEAAAAGVEGEAACPAAVDGAVPLGEDDPQAATRIAATMTEEREA